jgi:hypothetical protein
MKETSFDSWLNLGFQLACTVSVLFGEGDSAILFPFKDQGGSWRFTLLIKQQSGENRLEMVGNFKTNTQARKLRYQPRLERYEGWQDRIRGPYGDGLTMFKCAKQLQGCNLVLTWA